MNSKRLWAKIFPLKEGDYVKWKRFKSLNSRWRYGTITRAEFYWAGTSCFLIDQWYIVNTAKGDIIEKAKRRKKK